MATIIRLERTEECSQDRAVVDGGRRREAGEVILFPGVRYERWPEAADELDAAVPEGQRARKRAERDWLKI